MAWFKTSGERHSGRSQSVNLVNLVLNCPVLLVTIIFPTGFRLNYYKRPLRSFVCVFSAVAVLEKQFNQHILFGTNSENDFYFGVNKPRETCYFLYNYRLQVVVGGDLYIVVSKRPWTHNFSLINLQNVFSWSVAVRSNVPIEFNGIKN